eukprot:CAMPEP_0185572322 /NCGR_PEP_ID=MMETSP0434-20130131/4277_1 /TAXON_ID=626734 ORGANISM="Favella taraikaensis, Strain Fe Narragansett Bay" /NCGR_SAMPLE_ID=MMETSP0434 /ASSEMBLY_ACC=CAM_ASM_000379 /LENGTH=85 /DNA_ID=CAMNT_0028188157 /DNA_START=325 /DNA_END=582 /DNA_ORIENTATION=+
MSEEHPPSPHKLDESAAEKKPNEDKIKLIPYRPLKSTNDSENSENEPQRALIGSDSNSLQQRESRTSLQVTNTNLYRYVAGVGAH